MCELRGWGEVPRRFPIVPRWWLGWRPFAVGFDRAAPKVCIKTVWVALRSPCLLGRLVKAHMLRATEALGGRLFGDLLALMGAAANALSNSQRGGRFRR